MNEFLLWVLVFCPFVQTLFFAFAPKLLQSRLGFISSLFAAGYLAIVIHFSQNLDPANTLRVSQAWVPQLMVNLSFSADGLSLFFALLITGMGVLVSIYAQGYMDHSESRICKFYSYISIFMGAMLGTILADNLIVLFLFWEITGVISYLLIGYNDENVEAKKASRLAFLTTSLSGLCLLAGIVLIGVAGQTLELTEITSTGLIVTQNPSWVLPIMLLVLIGACGKSAQFPLHFWLPAAMTAPSPVSAYLHSATMVKLGVYLIARLFDLFSETSLWFPLVTTFSLSTVLIGGVFALRAYRLKQILAYATISQLGFFISFYGLGYPTGLAYDYVHIFNHSLYKGSLFMLVGILAHSANVTDVRHLVGLPRKMPFYSLIFAISLAAMAGIPGTTGFLSKELIIGDLVSAYKEQPSFALAAGTLLIGLLVKVAFTFRLFHYFFLNKEGVEIHIQRPPNWKLLFPPLLLSILALFWGIFPNSLERISRNYFIAGLHSLDAKEIVIWHGWGLNIAMSIFLFLGGIALFQFMRRFERGAQSAKSDHGLAELCSEFFDYLPFYAHKLTSTVHRPHAKNQIYWILAAFSLLIGGGILVNGAFFQLPEELSTLEAAEAMLIFATGLVLVMKTPLQRLISLCFVGFLIVYYFVLRQAPDLAMTQMVVEVATLFVLLLVFMKLPTGTKSTHNWKRLLIASIAGCSAALIPTFNGRFLGTDSLADFFLHNSIPFAGGANVVNTILVDFRALDTLVEITVIMVAALGIAAIGPRRTSYRLKHLPSFIPSPALPTIVPLIFLITIPFSIYITLRGHNQPGGGFTGGMILAISFVLLGMATRRSRLFLFDRINPLSLTLTGFLISLVSAVVSLADEGKFMVSRFYFDTVLLSTPVLFDFGVFLLVVGSVNLILGKIRNQTLLKDGQ
ncbi:MAG: multicomponent K+:H+ antiporter subunit A [Chlamydiales bacterium]|jgi:multicomponent K+:H+ antiporter subunit A